MLHSNLAATLLKLSGTTGMQSAKWSLKPDMTTAFFVEKGHVMETLEVKGTDKPIITLFFGPGEFAVLCHPLSNMVSLDNVAGNRFSHRMIFGALRKFPESHVHYREMRRKYHEKVAARLRILTTMSPQQRYDDLVANQPWVIKLAELEDIASYLGTSPELLREWKNRR